MKVFQIGDNTNTVVILAAALLEHASNLINMVCVRFLELNLFIMF